MVFFFFLWNIYKYTISLTHSQVFSIFHFTPTKTTKLILSSHATCNRQTILQMVVVVVEGRGVLKLKSTRHQLKLQPADLVNALTTNCKISISCESTMLSMMITSSTWPSLMQWFRYWLWIIHSTFINFHTLPFPYWSM